ncbi:MAG: sigma 54-interacting transcriptional regulator, partial [Bacteroidota bacterium]
IMVLSAYSDPDQVTEAIQNGANVYKDKGTYKPNTELFREEINELVREKKRKDEQREKMRVSVWGRSPNTTKLRRKIEELAQNRQSFLLVGQPGVGKQTLVNYLHFRSLHYVDSRPPLTEDLARIPDKTLRKFLYGESQRRNIFLKARNHILYLRNLPRVPLDLQEGLAQLVQNQHFLKGNEPLNIQFAFSLRVPPIQLVELGDLSPSLLGVLDRVTIDPLREKKADLYEMIPSWMEVHGYEHIPISEQVWEYYLHYHYPGNMRGLFRLLEDMMRRHKAQFSRRDAWKHTPIQTVNLPPELIAIDRQQMNLELEKIKLELASIEEALQVCQGKKGKAAAWLNISASKSGEEDDLSPEQENKRRVDKLGKRINSLRKQYPLLILQYPMIVKAYKLDDKP